MSMDENTDQDADCATSRRFDLADLNSCQFVKFVSWILICVHPCVSVVLFFVLALGFSARGASYVFNVNATIPDGDLNGFQNSQTISGFSGNISDVNVTLVISGGFNGDYYAFL